MQKRMRSDGVNPMPAIEPDTPPLDRVEQTIEHWLTQYVNARLSAKRRAAAVMITTSVLSGITAVLGALNVALSDGWLPAAVSVAITACSAMSGALVAWNEHFRHRDLWLIRSSTVLDLEALRDEFNLSRSAGAADANEFLERLHELREQALNSWLELHGTRRLPTKSV